VEVPDEDAETLQTVGDVIKYIEGRRRSKRRSRPRGTRTGGEADLRGYGSFSRALFHSRESRGMLRVGIP